MPDDNQKKDPFLDEGFLGDGMPAVATGRYGECEPILDLVETISVVMHRISMLATDRIRNRSVRHPTVRATIALLRAVGLVQGAILLLRRGMDVEARMLVRGALEVAFFLAALERNPDKVEQAFVADERASRRGKAVTLLDRGFMDPSDGQAAALSGFIRDIKQHKPSYLDISDLSKWGGLPKEYLVYQQMSSDAVHISADSLCRHIRLDPPHWTGYLYGPADALGVADALMHLTGIALIVTQKFILITRDELGSGDLEPLIKRYHELIGA